MQLHVLLPWVLGISCLCVSPQTGCTPRPAEGNHTRFPDVAQKGDLDFPLHIRRRNALPLHWVAWFLKCESVSPQAPVNASACWKSSIYLVAVKRLSGGKQKGRSIDVWTIQWTVSPSGIKHLIVTLLTLVHFRQQGYQRVYTPLPQQ